MRIGNKVNCAKVKSMIGKPKSERLWGKDYIIVMIASAGISFCNYFFFSTLPIYAQNLSGSTAYAGPPPLTLVKISRFVSK